MKYDSIITNQVNFSRQIEFDYAKAIAIIFMIIIHVYEELSCADIDALCSTPYDVILQFLGGPLAAPVFMTALGVGIVYSSHNTPILLCRRGIFIFLLGYALNFVRGGGLLIISTGSFFSEESLFINLNGDILQFAGLAFILTGILKKLRISVKILLPLAVLMQCVGQILSEFIVLDFGIGQCLLGLFFHTGEVSNFPLLNWYIYPVAGIILGKILRQLSDLDRFYSLCAVGSITILIGYIFALSFSGFDIRNFFALADQTYYCQTFLHFIFTFPIILSELSAFHFIHKRFSKPAFTDKILFLGKNLNKIYVVQWIMIGWSEIPFVCGIISPIEPILAIPLGILYFVLAVLIVRLYNKLRAVK